MLRSVELRFASHSCTKGDVVYGVYAPSLCGALAGGRPRSAVVCVSIATTTILSARCIRRCRDVSQVSTVEAQSLRFTSAGVLGRRDLD
jgi:hypothetical protein